MEFIRQIVQEFWLVLGEMAPYLLFGFFVAGLLSVFISPAMVERHLGGRDFLAVVKASLFGVPLPLCSCGVIPVTASLRRHGAGRGPAVAFLISTPQTGVDSIFVTFSLLGGLIAIFRPVAAFVSGLIGGAAVNLIDRASKEERLRQKPCAQTCCEPVNPIGGPGRFRRAMSYGFITLPADLGKVMLVGLVAAALISALVPDDFFVDAWGGILGGGILGMLLMMALGMPIYVCATASVPLAWALISKGVSPGAAMVFLMTGPATNAATIAILWKLMGRRSTVIYLATIALTALGSGLLLDWLFSLGILHTPHHADHAHWMIPQWFNSMSAVVLLGVLGSALYRSYRSPSVLPGRGLAGDVEHFVVEITGMTCSHCARVVQKALLKVPGITQARVDLGNSQAMIDGIGDVEESAVRQAIESAGYNVAKITRRQASPAENRSADEP